MKDWLKWMAFLSAGALIGYAFAQWENLPPEPVEDVNILARVGQRVISQDDYISEMKRRGGRLAGQYHSREQKEALLESMVKRLKMLEIAKSFSYEKTPEVRWAMDRVLIAKLQQSEIEDKLKNIRVTDSEIEAHYQNHMAEFAVPEQVKLALIVLPVDESQGEEAWGRAREKAALISSRLGELGNSQYDFGPLAQEFSSHRGSRYMGGAIDWLINHPSQITKNRWPDSVQVAGFLLKNNGEYSQVEVRGSDAKQKKSQGIYLVRLIDRKESKARSLAQVKKGLTYKLNREKKRQTEEDLYTSLLSNNVVINTWPDRLDQIQPISEASRPQKGPQPMPGAKK